ncbi:MAG: FCSD flavin-binding domain-containing protein [bacterium]
MSQVTRRQFGKLIVAAGATTLAGCNVASKGAAVGGVSSGKVVVVGGGFGGATAAKYLKMMDSNLEVTLIEPNRTFYTCPFSNLVIGGVKQMGDIAHSYDKLQSMYGVKVIHARASKVEAGAVVLEDGSRVPYDRAVVSPGIDVRYDKMPGHSQAIEENMPHAWKAGGQTVQLRNQLQAMPDGGTVIICPPDNPFRCPPGPYERASMIAHYLTQNKPKSKVLILDMKEKFSKQPLFTDGWNLHYREMIEWRQGSAGGKVLQVDAKNMQVETDFGWEQGDVINFIPAQWAGKIARDSGLTNEAGWCPVDQVTFESQKLPGVHVIGDASIAGAMPKSGFSANSQAKVCAAAIVSMMKGEQPVSPSFANTCYSLVTPNYSISVAAVYRYTEGKISGVAGAGGVSPKDADAAARAQEAVYAQGWYDSITQDMFA